jgi:hypothetical protein
MRNLSDESSANGRANIDHEKKLWRIPEPKLNGKK